MRYRKRPVEVEAELFTDNNSAERIVEWADGAVRAIYGRDGQVHHLEVETMEGTMLAPPGWYIIKGVQGEFYPCKETVFEQTYEKVD